ncbi:hypothetical protein FOMA001_g9791 [Fusarium oxysporum f. sp. matthiolae]|nr:hypothetical protein FOMA001_g9791 [Fusarium oxysporum f. sp. matthiolae]
MVMVAHDHSPEVVEWDLDQQDEMDEHVLELMKLNKGLKDIVCVSYDSHNRIIGVLVRFEYYSRGKLWIEDEWRDFWEFEDGPLKEKARGLMEKRFGFQTFIDYSES